jgi:hypothetical protein
MTEHEHSKIYASLRAEYHLDLDSDMASLIESEDRSKRVDGKQARAGRRFAAEYAQNHGVEGVRSLHRVLTGKGLPFDDSDQAADVALYNQIKDVSKDFRLGATMFCENSGVLG